MLRFIFPLLIIIFNASICCNGIFMKQNESGDDDSNSEIYAVHIVAISKKVYWDQCGIWGYGYEWMAQEWLCRNFYKNLPKNLLVLPEEWMLDDANGTINENNQTYECEWLGVAEVVAECGTQVQLETTTKLKNIDWYEPSRNFTLRLLLKVIDALAAPECSLEKAKYEIYIYPNYAEKALVKKIPLIFQNNKKLIEKIEIVPMTVAAANYYHRTVIQNIDILRCNFYDRYIYGVNANRYMEKLNKNWHQIYIFALSKNLTYSQLENIMNAAKMPISSYYKQPAANRTEPISIMIVGKQQLNEFYPVYGFCDDENVAIEECYKNIRLTKGAHFDTDLIDYINGNILRMVNRAIKSYYGKIFGAQLPPEQMADAIINKQIQPKPRIVLITDYVEMKFLNSTLPNENGFEFKVYALNKVVAEYFQGKADVVIQMDPDNPPIIPFTREQEEFSFPTAPTQTIEKESSSIFLIASITLGSAAGIILFISTLIYRRRFRRENWLHRLEKFKTQHLFDAYMNEKRNVGEGKEKAMDCWEIGWNKIILTNEQLGQGAFGEVKKATLTSQICDKNIPTQVAVKMLPMHASEKSRNAFMREIKIMKLLGDGHQCVVKMLGCMSQKEAVLGIVLEFCPGGSLLDHLGKLKKENCQKLCSPFSRWAWQIADGMVFLTGKNLVHRDLAARNVLLNENLIAKISDFGLCISLDEKLAKESEKNQEKLPLFILAPECLEKGEFSEKSDVWTFGLLLYEIYTFGINPFAGIDFDKLIEYIREFRPKKPEICPESIFEIMQKCLFLISALRPTFGEIKEKLTRTLERETVAYGYMDLNCQANSK